MPVLCRTPFHCRTTTGSFGDGQTQNHFIYILLAFRLIHRAQHHGDSYAQQNDAKAAAAVGVFLIADKLLGVLFAAPSGMAFGTIELPETIPPRLDRPRVMPERPSASAAPIRLTRRLPERPFQPPNQQEGMGTQKPSHTDTSPSPCQQTADADEISLDAPYIPLAMSWAHTPNSASVVACVSG